MPSAASLRRFTLPLAAALALGGCGHKEEAERKPLVSDPALAAALDQQIMIDPDLVAANGASAIAAVPDGDGMVPSLDLGADAAGRARAAALALVGGREAMKTAPEARKVSGALPPEARLTAAARAAVAPGGSARCAALVDYSAVWAARLPQAFPVYPQGAVQEAAGSDESGCALRVVNYRTPVSVADVMDFYFTRATAAGFTAQHVLQDGDDVLGGLRGAASYVVYVRKLPSGGTEVDLLTSGV